MRRWIRAMTSREATLPTVPHGSGPGTLLLLKKEEARSPQGCGCVGLHTPQLRGSSWSGWVRLRGPFGGGAFGGFHCWIHCFRGGLGPLGPLWDAIRTPMKGFHTHFTEAFASDSARRGLAREPVVFDLKFLISRGRLGFGSPMYQHTPCRSRGGLVGAQPARPRKPFTHSTLEPSPPLSLFALSSQTRLPRQKFGPGGQGGQNSGSGARLGGAFGGFTAARVA